MKIIRRILAGLCIVAILPISIFLGYLVLLFRIPVWSDNLFLKGLQVTGWGTLGIIGVLFAVLGPLIMFALLATLLWGDD